MLTTPRATPLLCRTARTLRQLSRTEFAALAGLAERTVAAFEIGDAVSAETVGAIEQTLERLGIEIVHRPDGAIGLFLQPAGGEVMATSGEPAA